MLGITSGSNQFILIMMLLCSTLNTLEISAHLEGHRDISDLDIYNRSSKTAHRIAGGYTASEGEFPSFLNVATFDNYGNVVTFCGGVAISERLVLTAGHCFKGEYEKMGASSSIWHPYTWKSKGVKIFEIDKSCGKPKYTIKPDGGVLYDYQVLRLKKPIPGIKYACLPKTPVPIGHRGLVVGNGEASQPENSSFLPHSLQALPVERIRCDYNDPAMICFKSYRANSVSGVCLGDSGGPVISKAVGGGEVVLGIVSNSGDPCGKGGTLPFGNADIHSESQTILDISRCCLRW